jgi:hypothetical protein
MIYKTISPLPGYVRVVFELPACLWADRIFLVGDFNQWDQTATPMQQDRDGIWRATVDLRYGTQAEFRYLIDGQWRTDYHADGHTSNSFGSENSLVRAELPEVMAALEVSGSHGREAINWPAARQAPIAAPTKTTRLQRPQRTVGSPTRAAA